MRPDVLPTEAVDSGREIPETMPSYEHNEELPSIEGIGQPMNAVFFTASKTDPKDW